MLLQLDHLFLFAIIEELGDVGAIRLQLDHLFLFAIIIQSFDDAEGRVAA